MSFLAWTFLLGAVAVIGPIVAHMLAKPRFRRVPFTMLQFLRTGRHESHARRNIRDLAVLLLRCVIIILMAMLFARPVLKVKATPPKHKAIHCLGLDDSASMAYVDERESLFERMVDAAVDQVRRAPEDAVFSICGLASGWLSQGLDRSQAIAEIKQMTVVSRMAHPTDFVQALRQASQAALPGETISATVFSDFTPAVLREFEQVREPAIVDRLSYEVIAGASPLSNVAVVEARVVDVVEGKLTADVIVANRGQVEQERRLVMEGAMGRPVAVDLVVAPGERRVVRMQRDLGPEAERPARLCIPLELSLEPEDRLAADDSYRLAVSIPQSVSTKVLVVQRADEAFLFETAIQALAKQGSPSRLTVREVVADRLRVEDLAWADVAVFSSFLADASFPAAPLKACLARGGRLVFFATDGGNPQVADRLLREGLLAALPQKWIPGVVYPDPQPVPGGTVFGEQTAKTFVNYRFDKIALKGHWLCRAPVESQCLWRLANGAGFVYGRLSHGGSTILVNTSMDDSLGLLAKSGAWVAFCRSLVGESGQIERFCVDSETRPVLNLPEILRPVGQTLVAIENSDGSKAQAAVEANRMVLPPPRGTGWMKTLKEPVLHVAVNLPEEETDLEPPAQETVEAVMKRVFVTAGGQRQAVIRAGAPTQDRPAWRTFAWATLLLLLVEPAITNRLKR